MRERDSACTERATVPAVSRCHAACTPFGSAMGIVMAVRVLGGAAVLGTVSVLLRWILRKRLPGPGRVTRWRFWETDDEREERERMLLLNAGLASHRGAKEHTDMVLEFRIKRDRDVLNHVLRVELASKMLTIHREDPPHPSSPSAQNTQRNHDHQGQRQEQEQHRQQHHRERSFEAFGNYPVEKSNVEVRPEDGPLPTTSDSQETAIGKMECTSGLVGADSRTDRIAADNSLPQAAVPPHMLQHGTLLDRALSASFRRRQSPGPVVSIRLQDVINAQGVFGHGGRRLRLLHHNPESVDHGKSDQSCLEIEFITKNSLRAFLNFIHSYLHQDRRSSVVLHCVTYNVGTGLPDYASLDSLLPSELDKLDIVVFGLQEVGKRAAWESAVCDLFRTSSFLKVRFFSSWDRAIMVFARSELMSVITNVEFLDSYVGVAGLAGNKGAIALRFCVYDTEYIIINAHLAAHASELSRRNADFAALSQKLVTEMERRKGVIFAPAHYIVWMGDLNYRLGASVDECSQWIAEQNWDAMFERDQLQLAQRSGDAFALFREPPIKFAPTYKLARDANIYTTDKNRVPSWTDRVLHLNLKGTRLRVLAYGSCADVLGSDHRPVFQTLSTDLIHTTGVQFRSRDLFFGLFDESQRKLQLKFKSLAVTYEPRPNSVPQQTEIQRSFCIEMSSQAFKETRKLVLRTKSGSYTPTWSSEELPCVDLYDRSLRATKRRYVQVSLSSVGVESNPYPVARGVIWLGSFPVSSLKTFSSLADARYTVDFDDILSSAGQRVGRVKGSFEVSSVN
ncbi:Inositol-1,4,5-trisphosphate 5-phosphatase 1 [Porphyridium purpureum]|uniref:Inositol-1,4,5-trisphosphate 5-phosphatase 1 n=1 Tax=Porphyridium purpureum TaxID=35688 RepID=A0A5J4YWK7_PORPP|nr:Inositol-1,4,5-trisphosphate 5-phosphatase 1 [Porphyridium purpureum]|eukprot:POR4160..scf209_3